MSHQQFTLEYLVKVTGGGAAGSQINQVNNQLKVGATNTQRLTKTQKDLGAVSGKTNQEMAKGVRNYKGLAFGIIGLVSAGVEAIGMLGMWADTVQRTGEAQAKLTKLIEQGKEGTKEFTDTSNELVKAQRFQAMTQRNLILSMFDMVPFTLLTINALVGLRREGVGLATIFGGLTRVFNAFRTTAVAPAVSDLARLGTTFSSLRTASLSTTAAEIGKLGTALTSFGTASALPLAARMSSLGTTFTTFKGTVIPLTATMNTASTAFKATAGSAIPLAGMISTVGVSSGVTAGAVGVLSGALRVLAANIRLVLLATGVGAVLVALGLFAEGWMRVADAAEEGSATVRKSIDDLKTETSTVTNATDALSENILSGFESTAKGVEDITQTTMDNIIAIAVESGKAINQVMTEQLEQQKADLQEQRDLLEDKGIGATVFGVFAVPGIDEKKTKEALDGLDTLITGIDKRLADYKTKFTPSPIAQAWVPSAAQIKEVQDVAKIIQSNATVAAQEVARLVRPLVMTGDFEGAAFQAKLFVGAWQMLGKLDSTQAAIAIDLVTNAIKLFEDGVAPASTAVTSLAAAFGGSIQDMSTSLNKVKPIILQTFTEMQNLIAEGMDPELVKKHAEDAIKAFIPDEKDQEMALFWLNKWWSTFDTTVSDATKKSEEHEVAMSSLQKQTSENVAAHIELETSLRGLMDTQGLTTAQLQAMEGLYADNIQVHLDAATAIKNEAIFWDILNEAQFQAALASQDFVLANTNVLSIFEDSRKNVLLYGQALIDGKTQAKDFMTELVLGTIKAESFHDELLNVAQPLLHDLPAGITLTTEELQRLLEAEAQVGYSSEVLADIIDERLAPAFETFNDVIHAEDLKDFREAFKEIDFGEMNKKAVKDIKDMFESMKKVSEQGLEMRNIVDALIIGLNNGELSSKTFRRGIDEIAESIERVMNLDPDAEQLDPFVDFLEDLDKEGRKDLIRYYGDDLQYLADKINSGDLTPQHVIAFYDRLGISFDGTTESLENMTKELEGHIKQFEDFQEDGDFGTLEDYDQNPLFTVGKDIKPLVDVQETLATNTGNLVTSTDNLKSSVDALNGTMGKNILPQYKPIVGDSYGNDGYGGDMCVDEYGRKVSCSTGKVSKNQPGGEVPKGDYGNGAYGTIDPNTGMPYVQPNTPGYMNTSEDEQSQLTIYDLMIMAAQKTALAIQNIYMAMSIEIVRIFSITAIGAITTLYIIPTSVNTIALLVAQTFTNMSITIQTIWSQMTLNITAMLTMISSAANTIVLLVAQTFLNMSITVQQMWSEMTLNIAAMWAILGIEIATFTATLVSGLNEMWSSTITSIGSMMSSLSSHWADMCNNMSAEGSHAGSQIASAIGSMVTQSGKHMSNLSSHWARMCKNMVSEAKSMARQINSALNSIEDEEVVIRYRKEGMAEGGIMSFAKGGIMSAAGGRIFRASGPQQITVGDNPGRNETVAFIPHNRPFDIMDRLNSMFGHNLSPRSSSGGGGGGNQGQGINVQVFLDGHEFQGKVVRIVKNNSSTFR